MSSEETLNKAFSGDPDPWKESREATERLVAKRKAEKEALVKLRLQNEELRRICDELAKRLEKQGGR